MSYIPVVPEKSLLLPIEGDESITYSFDGIVPDGAKEVLVYLFFSTRDSTLPDTARSYYEIYTKNNDIFDAPKYKQYMNVIFTKNDYVMNSANLWLPLFPDKKLTVHLHPDMRWPEGYNTKGAKRIQHKNLKEAMDDLANCKDPKQIFAEMFVIGYKL
jgi:hypothetical protein